MTSALFEAAYALDTNALIWPLTNRQRLSQKAKAVFDAAQRGETQLIISAVVLAEMFFADAKWGFFDDFTLVYHKLKAQPYIEFIPFDPDDVLDFELNAAVPELHDRIIAGIARRLGIPLITSDSLIHAAKIVPIIW